MGLRRGHDLEPEPLGEIHPAVMHDDDLRAAVGLQRRFPFGRSSRSGGKETRRGSPRSSAFSAGRSAASASTIDAVIGRAL